MIHLKSSSRRFKPICFLVWHCSRMQCALVTCLVAFCWSTAGADEATPATHPAMAVTVAKAKNACITDTIMVTGTIVPRNEILLRPDQDGLIIREIYVEPGKSVATGEKLARLQPVNDQQGSPVTILAPRGGLIVAGPTVEGQMVSSRGEPLFRLVPDGALELSAKVPANQAPRIFSADKPPVADVKVLGLDDPIPGRVRSVSTAIDAATQLGEVHILIASNDHVRIGTFARAIIKLGESCGLVVPLSAVLFQENRQAAVMVVRNDHVKMQNVEYGLFDKQNVQIRTEELKEGELVVVRAGAFLVGRDQVRPVLSGEESRR
jgi:HlyD family secretion protein